MMDIGSIEISEEIPILDGEAWVQFQRPARGDKVRIQQESVRGETKFTEGSRSWSQVDQISQTALDDLRVAYMLIGCSYTRGDKPVFVPGKNCREQGKPMTNAIELAFMVIWNGIQTVHTEPIINAMREWHPEFDWVNPVRGES
jgi:hypothetical protein